MDSEKTTLSDVNPEHDAEYNEVLAELRDAIFRRRPSDVYQFCSSFFHQKLSEQREGLLELVKLHPGILDSSGQVSTAAAAATAGAGGRDAAPSVGSNASTKTGRMSSSSASNLNAAAMRQDETPRESGPEASDSTDQQSLSMRQASEHAWGNSSGDSVYGMINPSFSFGSSQPTEALADDAMKVDDEDNEDESEEARDKFSSLVSIPPAGSVQPFAGRRFSVSAESMNPSTEPEYKKKFVPKTEKQKQRIHDALANNFLFKNLDEDSHRDVVDAMEEKHVQGGQSVIVQGGVGDYFYIVEKGTFDIFVRRTEADEPVKVAMVEDGGSFGELALMYNAPRAATVTATSDATLWALDRITFRSLLMERTSRKRRLYERFLETVPLLKSLEPYERQKIADALESVTYNDKETIVKQGDPGDDFFLIEQGTVRVYKTDADGVTREYPSLNQGGYFGELALLENQVRQATLVACGRTKCARMSKDAFDRLLGPVINIIRREAGNYMHIQSLKTS
ncbi:hypothetical protein GGI25_001737 [Coemansia spiralis]|uniref:cAMP-dependent protein kinase regulatory subunit n=2 Tax=Coemansia TaxID=4863 RepID=A0A9W8G530_9FUNG|nr:cyclic nucleotide-binding-like protein [Coemansia spiralis]KAJ1991419.1 hypothetical protein EDC05_003489 [Coemansia umbellata]KAJ2624923.1 hypothetical protein GGI26_001035 [Coemansia sp. RSA 1358]KAJ2679169.1 hypothetical protein GGI25_001737 [Coemansia spiralis]